MVAQTKAKAPSRKTALASTTSRIRTAAWLVNDFMSPVWKVRDSHGGKQVCEIDFRFPMPNGGTLLDYPKLYASIKDFSFLLRNPEYGRIQDAESHVALTRCLMIVAHGLVLDGLDSFRHATKAYLEVFLHRIIGATDGILKASERIRDWIDSRRDLTGEELQAQLPTRPQSRKVNILQTEKFLQQLGLPIGATAIPRVCHMLNVVRTRAAVKGANGSTLDGVPPSGPFTTTTIYRFFQVIELLYVMRRAMESESLPEPPFDQSATDLSEQHGIATKRTPLAPPKLALHLMSRAMVWVTNYSAQLLQLVRDAKDIPDDTRATRKMREAAFARLANSYPQSGPEGSPWPLNGNQVRNDDGALSMHQKVTMLMIACLIVIATFSARRLDELRGLEVGDIRGNKRAGWWMRAFIQKTLIAKEWIPTAEIVARAFEILTELSASARESLDNNLLLQWESPFYTEPQAIIDIVSDEAINMFAALVNTPSYEQKDGTSGEWHWTTHQFRRFFSVLYFYRYRGAKLEDLAHFLRHFDLDMTRKYLEITPQQKKEFEEVGRMYFGDIAKELLAQAGQSFGAGKALKKMLEDHFHANVHLSAPALEDVDEFADRLKSTRNIQVHPKPWVDCTCPLTKEGAKTAACAVHRLEPEAVGPELTFARPSVCAGCAHPIPNQHFDGYLELEERGVAVLADADIFKGTLLQGVAKARIIEIRSIRGEVSCV